MAISIHALHSWTTWGYGVTSYTQGIQVTGLRHGMRHVGDCLAESVSSSLRKLLSQAQESDLKTESGCADQFWLKEQGLFLTLV